MWLALWQHSFYCSGLEQNLSKVCLSHECCSPEVCRNVALREGDCVIGESICGFLVLEHVVPGVPFSQSEQAQFCRFLRVMDPVLYTSSIQLFLHLPENSRSIEFGYAVMINADSIWKSRDIALPTKVRLVNAMVFPVVMYGCESRTVKKAEHRRIVAFELWCWRWLLRVP